MSLNWGGRKYLKPADADVATLVAPASKVVQLPTDGTTFDPPHAILADRAGSCTIQALEGDPVASFPLTGQEQHVACTKISALLTTTKVYRVDEVLDDRTCPVCAMMHGKMFNVAVQLGRTVQALSTADPQDLKTISPWPGRSEASLAALKGMSNRELQAAGYGAPPYHAGCRGMLTEIGEDVEDFSSAAMDLAHQIIEGVTGDEATQTATAAATADLDSGAGAAASAWDDTAIEQLGWARFDVTDPEVFAAVDDAFQAKEYDEAQRMIDEWKAKNVSKEDGFEGPNQPKIKRKLQTPAGRQQDYDDIRSGSSSIVFDSGVMNDMHAPIARV